VLHHTGDLIRALGLAANLVSPGGLLALALYRKTLLCPLWKIEKKWYANASRQSQERARGIFIRAYAFGLRINGRNLADYERNYKSNRGMDFKHDVHDWMGGYPYESMSPSELEAVMNRRGLMFVKKYVIDSIFHRIGVFGSGCDEFVFAKPEMAAKAA
jgi:2-polyprenyl-6-hydroxyphenyl methylase/3-demethylubiquinone-9 3-methyltransferase